MAGIWSECGDLNPGPLGPEPSALPTALHPVSLSIIRFFPTAVKTEFSPAADDVVGLQYILGNRRKRYERYGLMC